MKIVVDIPDELYKEQLSNNWTGNIIIHNAIVNGTPLPKGHGRLIDADALNRKDVNCANTPMNFIDTAPTIIEADV